MTRRLSFVFAGLVTCGACLLEACDDASSAVPDGGNKDVDSGVVVPPPGSAKVRVTTDGATVSVASYAVTGPESFRRAGTFFANPTDAESVHVADVPVGTAYEVAITATTADGKTACSGTASFDVATAAVSDVLVALVCAPVPHTGSVLANGTPNLCPVLAETSANPSAVVVGSTIALGAVARDLDGSTLSYQWMASGGTLAGATTPSATLTCTAPGTVTVGVVVSDGDALATCAATQTSTVTCLPKTKTTLALFGDWPYSAALLASAPKLVASINSDPDVALAMHVGDIHSGSMPCADAWNQGIYDLFQQFQDPLVYTPGDNEWTDCQKVKEMSSGAPLDQLSRIRTLFFPTAGQTLGIAHRVVTSQATAFDASFASDAAYVENVMWSDANVVFATLNFPGSNNDTLPWNGTFSDPVSQADEVAKRTAANIRWINRVFAQAKASGAAGVVIGTQADMWDPAAVVTGGDGLDGYTSFVRQLAALTVEFGKPVLLVNGDSHVYEGDKPLADPTSATGVIHGVPYGVPNLSRITVEGSTAADEWVKLSIDTNTPAVFTWSRVTYVP